MSAIELVSDNDRALVTDSSGAVVEMVPIVGTGAQGPAGPEGPAGPAGNFANKYRGAWDSGTAYLTNDLVKSAGAVWLALAGSTNVTPVEGATWTKAVDKGTDGTGTGDFSGPGSSTTDNFVSFANTGGKLGKDSGKKATDFATAAQGTKADSALQVAAIGVTVQGYDADLQAIGVLTPTDGDVIQRVSGSWLNRTMAQLKTSLGLVKSDVGLGSVDNTSDASKPVSTATQTALDAKTDAVLSINAQTGTTYTFVLADAGKLVTLTNAASITATIPLNATVAYAIGTTIFLDARGAGVVTVAGTGGVTIEKDTGLKLTKDSIAVLTKLGTDTWNLTGKLAA